MIPAQSLEVAAHVVQLALTPVFLLSGIAALLNVFATRLGRVADQADNLAQASETTVRNVRLRVLRWRARALDSAVVLAAIAGACTCGAVLVLFLGEVKGSGAANLLFLLFGSALVLTMGALAAFVTEMLLAGRAGRSPPGGSDAQPLRPAKTELVVLASHCLGCRETQVLSGVPRGHAAASSV